MSLFKLNKPRQFRLTPRYYDEHKERLQESKERVMKQLDKENAASHIEGYRSEIHSSYASFRSNYRSEKRRKISMGLVVGFVILSAYLLINYAG